MKLPSTMNAMDLYMSSERTHTRNRYFPGIRKVSFHELSEFRRWNAFPVGCSRTMTHGKGILCFKSGQRLVVPMSIHPDAVAIVPSASIREMREWPTLKLRSRYGHLYPHTN